MLQHNWEDNLYVESIPHPPGNSRPSSRKASGRPREGVSQTQGGCLTSHTRRQIALLIGSVSSHLCLLLLLLCAARGKCEAESRSGLQGPLEDPKCVPHKPRGRVSQAALGGKFHFCLALFRRIRAFCCSCFVQALKVRIPMEVWSPRGLWKTRRGITQAILGGRYSC